MYMFWGRCCTDRWTLDIAMQTQRSLLAVPVALHWYIRWQWVACHRQHWTLWRIPGSFCKGNNDVSTFPKKTFCSRDRFNFSSTKDFSRYENMIFESLCIFYQNPTFLWYQFIFYKKSSVCMTLVLFLLLRYTTRKREIPRVAIIDL